MAKEIGRLVNLGIGKESVRGTAVTPTFWVPWREISDPDNKADGVNNNVSLGRLEDTDGYAIVNQYGQIGWKTKLKDTHPGLLLLSLLGNVGSVAKSAPNAVVYDHTFSVLQNVQHPSLSVTVKDANSDVTFPNTVIDMLKITAGIDDYIMYEVGTKSKISASSTTTVAYVAERDFLPKHVVFKKAATQAGLDAASAVSILSFEITISANTKHERALGPNPVVDVLGGPFSIEGSITLTHTDSTYSVLQNAGTYQALRFDMIHTDTIGTSANPELKIDLHKASIRNYNRTFPLDDTIEETFDFKAHVSLTDAKMATITLTNLQTSY